MIIGGKKVEHNIVKTLVIPWGDEEYVFKAQPVTDFEAFDQLCPQPMPKEIMRPGGEISRLVEDPAYKIKLDEWSQKKIDWMFLKSLEVTPDLKWETVDMNNPDTFENCRKELSEVFPPGIVFRIYELITDVCGLSQDKIDEATKRFLAGQVQAQGQEK